MNTKERITKIIKMLNIPAHLKGYHYIRYCIERVLADPKHTVYMTALYYTTAEAFDTKAQAVERNIRTAIAISWGRADTQILQDIFGYYKADDIPTNSEFIATIIDYMLIQQEDNNQTD